MISPGVEPGLMLKLVLQNTTKKPLRLGVLAIKFFSIFCRFDLLFNRAALIIDSQHGRRRHKAEKCLKFEEF